MNERQRKLYIKLLEEKLKKEINELLAIGAVILAIVIVILSL